MNKVLIFVDTREARNGILDYFWQYDCEVQTKMLVLGDFIASDRVIIEKKTVRDFVQSITDKRLFQQLGSMKDKFEKPILIIEGKENLYEFLQPNIIRGALAAIAVDMSIPIIWTKDLADTAGIIYWIARREQLQEKRDNVLRDKRVPDTLEEMQEYFISSLPDISTVRAKALLEYFKSPMKIFIAKEKELREVKGIGKGIAHKIKDVLDTEKQ